MSEQEQPIDFKTIAQAGSISVASLYRNEKLKSRIEELRAEQQVKRYASSRRTEDAGATAQTDLLSLKTENESLHKANQKLRQQNQQLKAEASLVQALERQIVKLQRENQHLLKKVMLLNAETSRA